MHRSVSMAACAMLSVVALHAQTDGSPRYEVVSIKRNANIDHSGGMMIRPDGYFQMTNQPIRNILSIASPVPVREVVGIPTGSARTATTSSPNRRRAWIAQSTVKWSGTC